MKNYFTLPRRVLYYSLVLVPRITRLFIFHYSQYIKSDELYLKIIFFLTFGKWLNFKHPETLRTFNEKTQWLKLHNNTQLHTQMVDKYEVRKIIEEKLGSGYTFPLLGVWNNADEIDFNKLPQQFVLKPTHDSGSIIICRDKTLLNQNTARQKLRQALIRNYYWLGREMPYKNVQPRIIAEPLMSDNETHSELKDYKLFCFDGVVKMIQVDYDRFTNHHRNLYTPEWRLIDAFILYPNDPNHIIEKPEVLPQMLEIGQKLSKGFPFVRIDLYVICNKVYFGEFTFHHEGGLGRIRPRQFNITMGDWIHLPI